MIAPDTPLVSTAWLASRLGAPDVRPVDASWWFAFEQRVAQAEFNAGHIPGAVFFDIDAIADRVSRLPHMLPPPAEFNLAMETLGISNSSTVVVYETGAPRAAPRVWWTLRAMGHSNVFVLDGGLRRWRAEGRQIETSPPRVERGAFSAAPDPSLVRNLADMRAILRDGSAQVVDARPTLRFQGDAPEPRAGLLAGHMPGAVNVPASRLYAEGGTLLPPDALGRHLGEAGVNLTDPVVATCGSGITACTIALALARLGRWDTAVYDGSWAEWGGHADAAVAIGP